MMKFMQAGITALVLASAIVAQAADWKSTTETDSKGRICVASQSVKQGKSTFTLQIRVRDGLTTTTEIIMSRVGPALAIKGFQGRVGGTGPLLQMASLEVQNGVEYYYGLPHGTLSILNAMAAHKELDLQPVGGEYEEIDFSLKKFSDAGKELSKCARNQALANHEFEQALVGGSTLSVDLARLTTTSTQSLRSIANEAYLVFLQRKANAQSIAEIRKKYQSEITEYERLKDRITQINGTELPNLASRRAKRVTELAQAEKELSDTQTNLPKIENRVATAQSAYNKASDILAPLIPRHDLLVDNVELAQSNLNASESRLRQVESDIPRTQQHIRDLQNRAVSLRYDIDRLRNDLTTARYELREADRNLQLFNYQAEVDRYLQANNHSGLKSQESSLQSQLYTAQTNTARARAERDSALSVLQQCQATGGDCSSQQMTYNGAQAALSQATSNENSINSQLQSVRSRVMEVERQARKQADNKRDTLQDRQRAAARKVNDIEMRITRAQDEISDIQNYQIPRNENLLRSLEAERSQLLRTIMNEEAALASAQRALADYERQVDWHTKKRNVDTTRAELNAANNALSYARLRLQQLPPEIAAYKREINEIDATVAQLRAELAQCEQAAAKLRPTISKYEAERAPFDAIEKRLAAEFSGHSQRYLANLRS